MDRMFFAFPEERQKESSLLRAGYISAKAGLPFTLLSGKSENKNPENPVDPV